MLSSMQYLPSNIVTQYPRLVDYTTADLGGTHQDDIVAISDTVGNGTVNNPDYHVAIQIFPAGGGAPISLDTSRYSASDEPVGILAGDLNGDGIQDLLVLSANQSPDGVNLDNNDATEATPYLGLGNHTYQIGPTTVTPYQADRFAPLSALGGIAGNAHAGCQLSDLNGDGIPDLVSLTYAWSGAAAISSPGGAIAVRLGNGEGSFGTPSYYSLPTPARPAVGDQRLDIYPEYCQFVVVDTTGDGVPDITALAWTETYGPYMWTNGPIWVTPTDPGGGQPYQRQIVTFPGNGDGTLGAPIIQPDVTSNNQLFLADLNGDGKPDIITAPDLSTSEMSPEQFGGPAINSYLNDGTAHYRKVWTAPAVDNGEDYVFSMGDFNGDGIVDLNAGYWLGNGDGTFTPNIPFAQPTTFAGIPAGFTQKVIASDNVGPLALAAATFSVSATDAAAQPIGAANLRLGTQTTTTHASQPKIVTNYGGLTVYTNAAPAPLLLDTPAQEVQRPGQTINLGAIRAGQAGPYTLSIDWGDGTRSQITLSGTAIPPQAHDYGFGYHTIRMALSDHDGDVAYNDISLLTARPHVTPPALGQPAPLMIGNGPASVVLAGADAAGAALTYSASASIAGVALAIVKNVLTVTPPLGYTGTFTVTATVSDGPSSASRTFSVSVLPSSPLLPQGYPAAPFGPAGTDPLTAEVDGMYKLILGRGPDPAGLAASVKYLGAGGSASVLAAILLTSTERETNLVQSYYHTFFGRAADPAGLAASVRALQAGMSEATLASILLATPEFSAHHPDNASFIGALYLDVLDRAAAPAEVAAWSGLLSSGKLTRAQAVSDFVGSAEAVDVAIEGAYLAVLGRPAAAFEVAAWQPLLTSGSSSIDGLVEGLFALPLYAARARAGK
jgi:hypothetical protein